MTRRSLQNPTSFLRPSTLKQGFRHTLSLAACASILVACSGTRDTISPQYALGEPDKPVLEDGTEVLGRDQVEPIISVPLTERTLIPRPLKPSDPLPEIQIDDFSAVDATALEAFRALLLDEGISVAADPNFVDVRINLFNVTGSLQDVMDRISETSGVYYHYKNELLTVTPTRTFIVPLPPIEDSFSGISSVITALGGVDVNVDSFARLITFRADRQSFEDIRSYLHEIKKTKVMLVYETHVFEVTLSDDRDVGINWNNLNANLGFGGDTASNNLTLMGGSGVSTALSGSALTMGAVFANENFTVDSAIQFLETQGTVETISKPTIALISGSAANFEVGSTVRFVSRVEVTTDGTGTDQVTNTSIDTEDLVTGLRIEISGDYIDETVFTSINLEVSELVNLGSATVRSGDTTDPNANSTEISLPETSARTLTTTIRSRPGDTLLLAGINESRDAATDTGTPKIGGVFPVLTRAAERTERSEVVIVMKPRVIRFDVLEEETPGRDVDVDKTLTPEPTAQNLEQGQETFRATPPTMMALPDQGEIDPVQLLDESAYTDKPLPHPERVTQMPKGPMTLEDQILAPGQDMELSSNPKAVRPTPVSSSTLSEPGLKMPASMKQSPSSEDYGRRVGNDPNLGKLQYFHRDGSVSDQ